MIGTSNPAHMLKFENKCDFLFWKKYKKYYSNILFRFFFLKEREMVHTHLSTQGGGAEGDRILGTMSSAMPDPGRDLMTEIMT